MEMDALREAWTLGQPYRTKSSFVSKLLVIGEYLINIDLTKLYLLPEKRVVPLTVLFAFFIYFGVAASFYFE